MFPYLSCGGGLVPGRVVHGDAKREERRSCMATGSGAF